MGARVLILGDGAMGQTLAQLLEGQHEVFQWATDLATWEENAPLETVAQERDFILFAVPANPHDQLARRIAPHIAARSICLTIAKGLDENARTPAEVLARNLPTANAFGVIYGPMIAAQLQANKPGFARIGIRTRKAFRQVFQLFAATPLRLAHSKDLTGLSWAVILKNVYVPLIAAADALDLGDNTRGYLVCRAVEEISRLIVHMGGQAISAYQEAGLGDLVTTATSASSHHRRIGIDLAAGRLDRIAADGVNIRGEGVHTIDMVKTHQLFEIDQYPMFAAMARTLEQPQSIATHIDALLAP